MNDWLDALRFLIDGINAVLRASLMWTSLSLISAATISLVWALATGVGSHVALASAKPNASKLTKHSLKIDARAIRSFSKSGQGNGRYGRLRFRGGLVLRSTDPAFGGFSGLEISADGSEIMAVSDAGSWLTAKLDYRGDHLVGISEARIAPILALSSKQLNRGRDRDAEGMRLLTGSLKTGTALVAFELNERIGLYDIVDGDLKAPTRYLRPPVRLVRNKGIEAVATIKKGPFEGAVVAFAERTLDGNGDHRGWMWPRSRAVPGKDARSKATIGSTVHALALTNPGGFDVTDGTGAADGGLYILERRFRWTEGIKMRIRRIAAASVRPGTVLSGDIMIEADLGSEIDNMEGIAMHLDQRKRTVLTLISDDNFNSFLQRTVLLQFEVVE